MTKKLTKSDQEEFYGEITKFYDLAEDIIVAIEKEEAKNPETQIKMVEPIIAQIEESTEILTESYINFVENGQKASAEDVKRVEMAIRKIFAKILEFTEKLKKMPAEMA